MSSKSPRRHAPRCAMESTEDAMRPICWPEYVAHHVIKPDDDSGWDEYAPIPIKGEKGQRAKDMEMGLDSAPSDWMSNAEVSICATAITLAR